MYKTYVSNIERDLLFEVITALKQGKTTQERITALAQEFVEITAKNSLDQIFKSLKSLSQKYREARNVFDTYFAQYMEDMKHEALKRARIYMRNGNIDHAVVTLKGVTHYDRNN